METTDRKSFVISSEVILRLSEQYKFSTHQAVVYYAVMDLGMSFEDVDVALGKWQGSTEQTYRNALFKVAVAEKKISRKVRK
jgi:ABC-type proline/glycine betaine transport system substrate-binding protein